MTNPKFRLYDFLNSWLSAEVKKKKKNSPSR